MLVAVGGLLGSDSGPLPGNSLVATGLISSGEFGIDDPHAGQVYDFAFSPLSNTSDQAVTVLAFRVRDMTSNVQLIGYRLYSAKRLGGVYAAHREGELESGIDLDHAPHARYPYTIPPHAESDRYAMARVRLTAFPPPGYVKGCEEIYRVGSDPRPRVQRFDCTYYFGEHADEYFDGRATLRLANSYAHDITVLGCPGCSPRGVRLTGLPSGVGGEGAGVGWDLEKGDSRRLDVLVGGRRVHCRPPSGSAALRYAARNGSDLDYDVTRDGRCVVVE